MLKPDRLHKWPENVSDAVKIQHELRSKVILQDTSQKPELITAVDTAYDEKINRLYAMAVTVKLPNMEIYEQAAAEMDAEFPYVPALRSFREGPVIIKALCRLKSNPDVVLFAGHGIAHPRRFGLASHLGLIFDIVSVGCARRKLAGEFVMPSEEKGDSSPLILNNKECGYVYRTRLNVKPMFISPGHRCSIRGAPDIVESCLSRFRIPIPLRLAHLFAIKYRKSSAWRITGEEFDCKTRIKI